MGSPRWAARGADHLLAIDRDALRAPEPRAGRRGGPPADPGPPCPPFPPGPPADVRLRVARGANRAGDVPAGGDAAGRAPGHRRLARARRPPPGLAAGILRVDEGIRRHPGARTRSPGSWILA